VKSDTTQHSETPWALDRFLTLASADDGWSAEVPPSWAPSAAHGGVLFGLAITAMRRRSPHPDMLTATAHFLRKTTPGPVRVSAELLRSGSAHATLQAGLFQDGKETVRVLAVFGRLPLDGPHTELEPPVLPPPEECVSIHGSARTPGPDPLDYSSTLDVRIHPEVQWPHGRLGGRAEVTGWCRMVDDRPHDDASLALLADSFPPPVFDVFPISYVPTLELTVHIRGVPTGSWLRGRFATRAINDPYVEEDGQLWDGRGNLIVMSRQLALIDRSTRRPMRPISDG
jgi:acyl-CoA thioesterase